MKPSPLFTVAMMALLMALSASPQTIATSTPTPVDSADLRVFPGDLVCDEDKEAITDEGPSWMSITVGQSTLAEVEQVLSTFSDEYLFIHGDDYDTRFVLPNITQFPPGIPYAVRLCLAGDTIQALAVTYLFGSRPNLTDFIIQFGEPDAITWDDGPSGRVAFWFEHGFAVGVSVVPNDPDTSLIPSFGRVGGEIYFPSQDVEGYENRWPYNQTRKFNEFLVHPEKADFGPENPFDFEEMNATITITPSAPYSLIAFYSDRDGGPGEIYVINPDGSDPVNLTQNDLYDTVPRWIAGTGQITFSAFRNEHEQRIFPYIMNADGSDNELFAFMPLLIDQGFDDVSKIFPSPDGRQILFVVERMSSDIYLLDLTDPNPKPIKITNNPADDDGPDWSPDGSKIAFYSDRSGNNEVYVLDMINPGEPVNLTQNELVDSSPSWSPDGEKIAFISTRDGNPEIYVMDADGANTRRLTDNPAIDGHPDWSPDGNFIVFDTDRDGNDEIYVMNADGGNPINLTNNPAEDAFPSWSPWLPITEQTGS